MKYLFYVICVMCLCVSLGCEFKAGQEEKDSQSVNAQQEQYAAKQPVPAFNFSYEREIVRQMYMIRNRQVSTHTVWRSDYGMIEGDCPCVGYPIPYTTSLTNSSQIAIKRVPNIGYYSGVVEQAEPNGLFPSKSTSATWIPCVDGMGGIAPVYVESKVTAYPYPVKVDYEKNRVYKDGEVKVNFKPNTQ